jgi:hypothetical protein
VAQHARYLHLMQTMHACCLHLNAGYIHYFPVHADYTTITIDHSANHYWSSPSPVSTPPLDEQFDSHAPLMGETRPLYFSFLHGPTVSHHGSNLNSAKYSAFEIPSVQSYIMSERVCNIGHIFMVQRLLGSGDNLAQNSAFEVSLSGQTKT